MVAKLSVARLVAMDAYVRVMENGEKPELVCEELFSELDKPLKRIDKNFVKECLFGSLRWHGKIFWIVQNTSKRDLKKSSPEIRAALVVGTYQIFYMTKVPDRAAVNESAEYIRAKGQANAVSFVNGILRQIARRAEYFAKPDKDKQQAEYLSLQYSHPKWMIDRWLKRFRFERLTEMLAACQVAPPWSVRINSKVVPVDSMHEFPSEILRSEKTGSERRPLKGCLRLKNSPRMDEGSLFQKGYFTVQDEAAQLIGLLVAPKPDEKILDVCAGPGGKTSHLDALAEGKAQITAIEADEGQLQRGQDNCRRLGSENVDWVLTNFLDFRPGEEGDYDRILLDAPCSGMGVLRRHPEGRWHKKPAIVNQMATKQRELIKHAMSLVKPGGELVFSVCSFEPEESLGHLKWIEKDFADTWQTISPVSRLPDYYKKYVTRDNVLMIYGGNADQMDGFGAFIVRRS